MRIILAAETVRSCKLSRNSLNKADVGAAEGMLMGTSVDNNGKNLLLCPKNYDRGTTIETATITRTMAPKHRDFFL